MTLTTHLRKKCKKRKRKVRAVQNKMRRGMVQSQAGCLYRVSHSELDPGTRHPFLCVHDDRAEAAVPRHVPEAVARRRGGPESRPDR